jgi:hypothetical protein
MMLKMLLNAKMAIKIFHVAGSFSFCADFVLNVYQKCMAPVRHRKN